MVSCKFAAGDRVQLRLATHVDGFPQDIYSILRRLPPEANVCQYRVKRVQDGQERVVTENELVTLTFPKDVRRAHERAVDTQLELQRMRNEGARARGRAAAIRTNQGR
jgi:hypothetical protein